MQPNMDADLVEYGSSSDDEKKLIKQTVDKKTVFKKFLLLISPPLAVFTEIS